MKARIKKTGEIINIADYARVTLDKCNGYGTPIEMSFEDVEILQDKSDDIIDWEQRRYEIAKAAMNGILSNEKEVQCACYEYKQEINTTPEAVAKYAVACTDALIDELKK